MIIGVGSNNSQVPVWRSPDLPAPTITTADQKEGAVGWLLFNDSPERERERVAQA